VQYADHAAWQREHLRGPVLDAQVAWWKERLAGAPELLELPADRARPAVQSYRGGFEPLHLPAALAGRLRALARREGATLYMVLLGAFKVLLSKYAGTDDVVVGTTLAGRTRAETEPLVGLFMNTLVLRTGLGGDPAFREVLRRVREVTLGAYEHQEVPFERLVAELRPERTLSHSTLFQVLFELHEDEGAAAALPGLDVRELEVETGTAKVDVSLALSARGGALEGGIAYATDLFERGTIVRMLAHLQRVLEQVADDPARRLSRLELMTRPERVRVLGWNRTTAAYPAERCIHQLFEEQARRTPDAAAVVFGGRAMTYRELDERANRLAHHLAGLGVGPEVRVGLCLERGLELMPAILGVMKAGGAYVPVDPSHPAERIGYVLDDSRVEVLLTQETLRGSVDVRPGVRVVFVDADAAAIAGERADAPETGVTSENLAYVIYTSGSTGRPKGVAMHHRGVSNYIHWGVRAYGAGQGQGAPVFSSMAVDLTITNLLPLFAGLPIHLLPEENPVEALAEVIRTRPRFGLIKITPVHLTLLTPLLTAEEARSAAHTLVIGADFLAAEPTVFWQENAPGVRLMNEYGPTETVVGCSAYVLPTGKHRAGPVPVGHPIQNLTFYVLDPSLQPVPVGLPGELYIGGAGVARGYLGRPSLSAEKFVPDPFTGTGARMYRTGDRARWQADGNLLILGRTDHQVKIRGYRVELGEVEAVLRRHPGVSSSLVVVREDVPGEKRLVAYVVGSADAPALREHLRKSLPEYMVPSAFVPLEALPKTRTGKIDPKTLPAPEYAAAEGGYVEPRNAVERALAAIWAEVLRQERVGVEDRFFELGGDSILSIQVVSRARRAGLEMSPRQMFEYQTIAELAAVVGMAPAAQPREDQGRAEGSARLTPVQSYFFEQELAAPGHYNQSVLLEVDAAVGDAALEAALPAVLEHHDALRLRFRRSDAGWEQWHAAQTGVVLERVDLSGLGDDEQDAAQGEAAQARQAGLDLERGPLARAVLFDRGARGRVLLLAIHHLVVDAVSWRILREDLERACAQAQAGEPVELGEKSTPFGRWGAVLEAYAASAAVQDEAGYWLAQGGEGVAPLPVDGAGEPVAAGARTVRVSLDARETHALLHEVPAAYRTQINDVLLCALADAVGRWSGGPRVRLALEGHGREEEVGAGVDLTRTLGWFTTVYPVVLDAAPGAGPGERLKRVKEALRAIPLRGIGYGALRYLGASAQVRAALAAQPEPQISFNYLGQLDAATSADTRLRFVDGPHGNDSAGENRRRYLLDVGGSVTGGCLELFWMYGEETHRRETVERLAALYLESLRALIAHCREDGAGGCTPADFPLAALSQGGLDALLAGRSGVEDLYPLSPMQEGILFHAQYGGEQQAYQVQVALRLEGSVDDALFPRAWAEVASRHAILRTAFAWAGLERPLQRVEPAVELPWHTEDWRGLEEGGQEAALERYLAGDRARGFALDEAPLMRCALFRVADGARWLVWSHHHLLTDGWSSSRILGEVLGLVRAWSAGEAVELRRVRPYRDYIAWLERRDARAAEAYWTRVLAGFTAPTPLGMDAGAGAEGQLRRTLVLSADHTRRLEEAARSRQVTVNTLVQGAWAVLLARYSGERDVVFGATVSGRPAELEGVEEMVGVFINALPVRVEVDGSARLGEWLAGLQRAQAEAREHEYTPLVQVQGWSEVPRGTPLFESLVVFENYAADPDADVGAGRLRVASARAEEWTPYPITLVAAPGSEMELGLRWDAGRLGADGAERMLEQLARLLDQAAAGPDVRLADLDLLGEDERRQVLEEWNPSGLRHPSNDSIQAHFEAQAAGTPTAPAVLWDGGALAYGELNERANRLARHLVSLGVGRETRVGICLERGAEMIVAMLAVLKAGGAYVPLDPGYPAERLAWMTADSGAAVLVTRDALRGALSDVSPGARVVSVDGDAGLVAACGAGNPPAASGPGSLAYVIYTSGSTGTPKGVAAEHRGVVRLVRGTDYVALGPADRVAQASTASFDAATFEIWGALLNGAAMVMVARDAALDPAGLAAVIRERGITTLFLTTALFNQVAREVPGAFGPLGTLLFGGELVDPAAVRMVLSAGAPGQLLHVYGPTENTTFSTWHRVDAVAEGAQTVPIGRAVGHSTAYVVDAAGRPVPAGVAGELFVGGDGLSRGYLGRPALTAERFVPNPFGGEPGARMYRTGDRVRWTAGGAVEYLGRFDHQVKIRGFRIEPGEVESVVAAHPAVREARVVVREDVPGEKRLVAYVEGEVGAEELREHLRRTLPEHMVPAAVVVMEALPINANGKVDRKALPAPDFASSDGRYVAPRTPVEEVLAGIWAEVLGLERVGTADGFFELGGHSLLATRLMSRIRTVFAVELPLRALFERPTVAGLAEAVDEARRAGLPVLPPVLPVARDRALPLSFAQERLWFFDRMQPGSTVYNVNMPLRLSGALDAAAMERALGEIVRRHEALRTVFGEVDGSPVQVVTPFRGFTLPVDDVSGLAPDEREAEVLRRAREQAATPFDLGAGPLFRAALVRLRAEEHALLLSMHHVVSDGWSLGVLLREMSALYAAYQGGGESPLAELPVQYADHAVWQGGQLRGEVLERQMAYWRGQLSGAPALIELPTDFPRPAVQAYAGASERIELGPVLLERLRALGRAEGATLFMVGLAAFQVLLAKYGAGDDVVVGTAIAGRTRREVEELIGFFVNTLALRTDLSGDPSFAGALGRVREATLGAHEHQELPFEKLVAELQPERSLSYSPLFQVSFTMDDEVGAGGELAGLRMEHLEAGPAAIKVDLALSLSAGEEGFSAELAYRTDLFEPGTARRMLGHLARVLEQAAASPALRLSRLELLDAAERRRVVEEWNRDRGDVATGCIHEHFAAQARRAPHAHALAWRGGATTYRELDEAANRLAHHLAARGVGPEVRVGLMAERTPETVVAILAILKAGGAYVPLDPAYPADRLGYMLADSGVRLVVAQGALPAGLDAAAVEVVDLRADAGAIAACPAWAPRVSVDPENLAYVIYTSGSSGRPKGVAVAHRGVPALAAWKRTRMGEGAHDRELQFASFSFDAAVHEVLGGLLNGATLVLAPREALLPGGPLAETLRRERVTLATLPPSVLALMDPASAPGLRAVMSAGEALPPAVAARWAAAVELHDGYGPTEATVAAASARVRADGRGTGIGTPLDGARACVLDAAGRPVPPGVPGELYLGGIGLARGYLDRPGLTAERFVPDALSGRAGARLYRTGDRARWMERDGAPGTGSAERVDAFGDSTAGFLEYLGRVDGQVKIRGFRIEPGEIEAALHRHPGVADCAVIVREDVPGERRLVAYVAGAADAAELRAHLRRSLPDYMVPSAFVAVERLPQTPNGKLDRRALPAPVAAGVEPGRGLEPQNALEARIAGVWREVLGVNAVGVEDNFFDLGGHSLLLVKLQTGLAAELGREVPVVELFGYPTVRSLAGWLQAAKTDTGAVDEGGERGGARHAGVGRLEARRAAGRARRPA
jgi:amino acid adenylation domain-containing protein/non-ribosomal peptide synthase protein (TIGR01720 family)